MAIQTEQYGSRGSVSNPFPDGNAVPSPSASQASSGPRTTAPAVSNDAGTIALDVMQTAALILAMCQDGLSSKTSALKDRQQLQAKVAMEEISKLHKQMKAQAKAAHSSLIKKIFGWIGKVVTLAVAAAATVLSGGALGFMMAASLALCMYDIASSAAMEANKNLKIGLADGLGKFCGALAKACGASEEDVKKAEQFGGMALAMVIQIAVALAAGGVCAGKTTSELTDKCSEAFKSLGKFFTGLGTAPGKVVGEGFQKLAESPKMLTDFLKKTGDRLLSGGTATAKGVPSDALSTAERISQAIQSTTQTFNAGARVQQGLGFFQGGVAIGQGATEVVSGVDQYHAEQIEADHLEIQAGIEFLQDMMSTMTQELQLEIETTGKTINVTTDMLEKLAQASIQVAKNTR